jgi:hypothetical protein
LVARSHYLLVFFIITVHSYKFVHTHSFITFAEFHFSFFIAASSGRGSPLGCRAEIRTRGRLTAARQATNRAMPHPLSHAAPYRAMPHPDRAMPHPTEPCRTLTEPCRTLTEPCRTLQSHAAPYRAMPHRTMRHLCPLVLSLIRSRYTHIVH